jgi:hypothetical protein
MLPVTVVEFHDHDPAAGGAGGTNGFGGGAFLADTEVVMMPKINRVINNEDTIRFFI